MKRCLFLLALLFSFQFIPGITQPAHATDVDALTDAVDLRGSLEGTLWRDGDPDETVILTGISSLGENIEVRFPVQALRQYESIRDGDAPVIETKEIRTIRAFERPPGHTTGGKLTNITFRESSVSPGDIFSFQAHLTYTYYKLSEDTRPHHKVVFFPTNESFIFPFSAVEPWVRETVTREEYLYGLLPSDLFTGAPSITFARLEDDPGPNIEHTRYEYFMNLGDLMAGGLLSMHEFLPENIGEEKEFNLKGCGVEMEANLIRASDPDDFTTTPVEVKISARSIRKVTDDSYAWKVHIEYSYDKEPGVFYQKVELNSGFDSLVACDDELPESDPDLSEPDLEVGEGSLPDDPSLTEDEPANLSLRGGGGFLACSLQSPNGTPVWDFALLMLFLLPLFSGYLFRQINKDK